MKYYIQTLGCQMNHSDSERVASVLEKIGYERTEKAEETDLYIFNSCSIRQKGEDRVYGMFKNLINWKERNPRLLTGITGCMIRKTSTRNSEKKDKDKLFNKLESLDFVFRIEDTQKLGDILAEAEVQMEIPNLPEKKLCDYLRITPKYKNPLLAYVPIQTGCDKYCTYCIVPYARGREKSRPMKDILEECTALVENGCCEITLGGQNVNAYGKSALDTEHRDFTDLKSDPFIRLLTELNKLKEKGLYKLNFTAPHPRHFTDELIQAHVDLGTLPNHIHLPVQSGDNEILQKMNRKYTVEEYREIIKKFRATNPGCSVTTDIIVGFCGETEEQFENTRRLFEELRFDMAFIARYSQRPGTVSAQAFKDDITREEKARRWHILNKLLEQCSTEFNESFVGQCVEVLVEKYEPEGENGKKIGAQPGECEGKTRENIIVQFKGSEDLVGKVVEVDVIKALTWAVKGEVRG
jgi:tRNA-2-methylthio-N6-dimethylallyladenosine synthase